MGAASLLRILRKGFQNSFDRIRKEMFGLRHEKMLYPGERTVDAVSYLRVSAYEHCVRCSPPANSLTGRNFGEYSYGRGA